jgi:hypothetical protein
MLVILGYIFLMTVTGVIWSLLRSARRKLNLLTVSLFETSNALGEMINLNLALLNRLEVTDIVEYENYDSLHAEIRNYLDESGGDVHGNDKG